MHYIDRPQQNQHLDGTEGQHHAADAAVEHATRRNAVPCQDEGLVLVLKDSNGKWNSVPL